MSSTLPTTATNITLDIKMPQDPIPSKPYKETTPFSSLLFKLLYI